MKKKLLFIIFIFINFNLFSLESFELSPIHFSKEISIISETIYANDTFINAKIDFKSPCKNIDCVIECQPNGYGCSFTIGALPDNFKIKCNNKNIKYEILYNGKKYNSEEAMKIHANKKSEILFTITFKQNEINTLEISYQNYTFINNAFLDISNNQSRITYSFLSKESKKCFYYYENQNTASFLCNCYVITNNDRIKLNLLRTINNKLLEWNYKLENNCDKIEYWIQTFECNTYYLDFSNNIIPLPLLKNNLFFLSKEQLAILRNSIYATHGYNFKNPKWKEYFTENFYGYKINPNFSESDFTDIEKKNLELIKYMENTTDTLLLSDFRNLEEDDED